MTAKSENGAKPLPERRLRLNEDWLATLVGLSILGLLGWLPKGVLW